MALPLIARPEVPLHDRHHFNYHICPDGNPGTDGPLDRVDPADFPPGQRFVRFRRRLMVNYDMPLPFRVATRIGKPALRMWVIEDPDAPNELRRQFPSAPIRLVVGDVVHCEMNVSSNTHTIHWHGIEPGPGNDGVGKHSFEVSSNFVYQFQVHSPGTFFYHCHKNTTLHFEMGLYGGLIVDPMNPDGLLGGLQPPYPLGGPGVCATVDSTLPGFLNNRAPYDVEALWAVDEMDSRWHELSHQAFMQACGDGSMPREDFTQDGILHDFRPDVFAISGVVSEPSAADPCVSDDSIPQPGAITAKPGQLILLRIICAGYILHEYSFSLPGRVLGMDGHPCGLPPGDRYSYPFDLPAGRPFILTSARRWDIAFRAPTQPGVYEFGKINYLDSCSRRKLYTLNTKLTVVPA
jgi:FtsP/CotA-like multicopper oxidase with cupredoxin domain